MDSEKIMDERLRIAWEVAEQALRKEEPWRFCDRCGLYLINGRTTCDRCDD